MGVTVALVAVCFVLCCCYSVCQTHNSQQFRNTTFVRYCFLFGFPPPPSVLLLRPFSFLPLCLFPSQFPPPSCFPFRPLIPLKDLVSNTNHVRQEECSKAQRYLRKVDREIHYLTKALRRAELRVWQAELLEFITANHSSASCPSSTPSWQYPYPSHIPLFPDEASSLVNIFLPAGANAVHSILSMDTLPLSFRVAAIGLLIWPESLEQFKGTCGMVAVLCVAAQWAPEKFASLFATIFTRRSFEYRFGWVDLPSDNWLLGRLGGFMASWKEYKTREGDDRVKQVVHFAMARALMELWSLTDNGALYSFAKQFSQQFNSLDLKTGDLALEAIHIRYLLEDIFGAKVFGVPGVQITPGKNDWRGDFERLVREVNGCFQDKHVFPKPFALAGVNGFNEAMRLEVEVDQPYIPREEARFTHWVIITGEILWADGYYLIPVWTYQDRYTLLVHESVVDQYFIVAEYGSF